MIHNYWPQGYREDFQSQNPIEPLLKALGTLKGDRCMEIGCGDGYWTTQLLVPRFKEVVAVDMIDKPTHFNGEYYKVNDCNLSMFPDKSFDIVYSYGVFCHLPLIDQAEYLKSIRRVLNGTALIMFANWPRHYALKDINRAETAGWYYNDLTVTRQMIERAGFSMVDFDPTYRDTIAILI